MDTILNQIIEYRRPDHCISITIIRYGCGTFQNQWPYAGGDRRAGRGGGQNSASTTIQMRPIS